MRVVKEPISSIEVQSGGRKVAISCHGDPDNQVVLCVPGYGDLKEAYRLAGPYLVDEKFFVVLMDLRGHGDSSALFDTFTPEDVGEDVLKVLETVAPKKDQKAFLVGASFSASACVWAAAKQPKRIAGLVLIGPFLRDYNLSWSANAMLNVSLVGLWGRAAWISYYRSMFPSEKLFDFEPYLTHLRSTLDRRGHFEALKGMAYATRTTCEQRLPELKDEQIPALVVVGTADPVLSDAEAEAKWLAEQLFNAEIKVVEGAGHCPHHEYAKQTSIAIIKFFKRVQSAQQQVMQLEDVLSGDTPDVFKALGRESTKNKGKGKEEEDAPVAKRASGSVVRGKGSSSTDKEASGDSGITRAKSRGEIGTGSGSPRSKIASGGSWESARSRTSEAEAGMDAASKRKSKGEIGRGRTSDRESSDDIKSATTDTVKSEGESSSDGATLSKAKSRGELVRGRTSGAVSPRGEKEPLVAIGRGKATPPASPRSSVSEAGGPVVAVGRAKAATAATSSGTPEKEASAVPAPLTAVGRGRAAAVPPIARMSDRETGSVRARPESPRTSMSASPRNSMPSPRGALVSPRGPIVAIGRGKSSAGEPTGASRVKADKDKDEPVVGSKDDGNELKVDDAAASAADNKSEKSDNIFGDYDESKY